MMFDEGVSSKQISLKLNISNTDVIKITKTLERKYKIFSEHSKNEIISCYKAGSTIKNLAEIWQISQSKVRYICRTVKKSIISLPIDESMFDNIDAPDKAYWLGWMFSDGNNFISKSKQKQWKRISISLHQDDYKHLYKFCRFLKHPETQVKLFSRFKNNKEYKTSTIEISNNHLSNALSNIGCVPNKTLIAKYPKINNIFNKDFIKGYFEGDGSLCLCKPKNKKEYWNFNIVGTKEVCEEINNVFKTQLNINISVIQTKHAIKHNINTFILTTNNIIYIKKIMDFIYSSSKSNNVLDRKYIKYLEFLNFSKEKIFKDQYHINWQKNENWIQPTLQELS